MTKEKYSIEVTSGRHVGTLREWCKRHFWNGENVIWGSTDELKGTLTIVALEEIAHRIRHATLLEIGVRTSAGPQPTAHQQLNKLIDFITIPQDPHHFISRNDQISWLLNICFRLRFFDVMGNLEECEKYAKEREVSYRKVNNLKHEGPDKKGGLAYVLDLFSKTFGMEAGPTLMWSLVNEEKFGLLRWVTFACMCWSKDEATKKEGEETK